MQKGRTYEKTCFSKHTMEVLKEDIVLYYWELMNCGSSGAGQMMQQGAREQEYRNRRSGLGGTKDGDC